MANFIKNIDKILEETEEDFCVSPNVASSVFSAYKDVLLNIESIPWKKLVEVGWVKERNDFVALANHIASPGLKGDLAPTLYRKHENADQFLIDLWLKRVDHIAAERIFENEILKFEPGAISKDFLSNFAQYSKHPDDLPNVVAKLAAVGIILVVCPGPQGIKTDGVVYLAPNGTPIVGLTLRYSRLDYFWFTLLHELSHVALHLDKLHTPIVDEVDVKSKDVSEVQANRLAKDSIVARYLWERCEPRFNPTTETVLSFSNSIGVHPALVAGLLQFELDRYDLLRNIVDEVDVRSYF